MASPVSAQLFIDNATFFIQTGATTNSRVILHLCRHAIELFLKGAISKARNRQPPKTHNLVNLVGEYELALPGENFRFEVPFGVEALGNLALFPELEALIDEHHKTR